MKHESRRVDAGLSGAEAESKAGSKVRDSGWRRQGGQGGFLDEAGEVKQEREGIADGGSLGRVDQAEPGGTFQVAVSLGGIAALGIGLSADAQLPGVGTDLHVTRQADGAIREGQAGGDGSAERVGGIGERTGGARGLGLGGKLDIRLGLVEALLAADPFGGLVLVVVAVAGQAVAEGAEGDAVLVVAALQAGQGLVVALGMARGGWCARHAGPCGRR